MENSEYKIEIKLPSVLTVHIPAFSEMTIEKLFGVISSDVAKNLIRNTLTEKIATEFMKVNEKSIAKYIQIYMDKNRDAVLESVKEKLDL